MPPEAANVPIEDPPAPAQDPAGLRAALADRILDFLSSPWLDAAPDRLREVTLGNPLEFYRRSPASWRRFARGACSVWGLSPCWHAFPREDNSRIMLLSGEETRDLVDLLGLVGLAPRLRGIIDGERIRRLRHAFPALYPDCLRLAAGIPPALLGSIAPGSGAGASGEPAPEEVRARGTLLLSGMLRHLPEELRRRWRLRFPAGTVFAPSPATPGVPESNALLLGLLRHLNLEAWRLCCC